MGFIKLYSKHLVLVMTYEKEEDTGNNSETEHADSVLRKCGFGDNKMYSFNCKRPIKEKRSPNKH